MNRPKEQKKQIEEVTRNNDITRILSGRGLRKNKPIKVDKGERLVTQQQQVKRWEEYFSRILNKD
jgi:hypothetical protein